MGLRVTGGRGQVVGTYAVGREAQTIRSVSRRGFDGWILTGTQHTRRARKRREWKLDEEGAPLPLPAPHPDPAAVRLDRDTTEGQPKSGTPHARSVGRTNLFELLEDEIPGPVSATVSTIPAGSRRAPKVSVTGTGECVTAFCTRFASTRLSNVLSAENTGASSVTSVRAVVCS